MNLPLDQERNARRFFDKVLESRGAQASTIRGHVNFLIPPQRRSQSLCDFRPEDMRRCILFALVLTARVFARGTDFTSLKVKRLGSVCGWKAGQPLLTWMDLKIMKSHTLTFAAFVATIATFGQAAEPQADMVDYVNGSVRGWFAGADVQAAISASNAAHAGMSESDLVALDKKWRAEIGKSPAPTINPVLNSAVSEMLRGHVAESQGAITEIILMDNRGMNVAVSAVTSDFWQGDEAKYQETFPAGADAVHVGDIELDESSQTYQVQVSFVVSDANGMPVGAVTVGLNAENF